MFPTTAPGTADMRVAADVLDRTLPPDRIVVTDSGRFSRAPWRHLRVNDPRDFVYTTSFGFIGLGISTAIGAAVGRPDRVTVGVVGDGGGMMGLIELSTAVRSAIPVLIVVMNDRSYGSEYSKLFAFGLDPHYPLVDWPDLGEVARELGARGRTEQSCDDVESAVREHLANPVPTLIDVRCDPTIDPYAGKR